MVRLFLALSLALCAFAVPAAAQERPRTILVMDGSGSMWGQIDGVNKIVIARDVIGTLLADFPPDQELGLTVYGHRRKGDCSDIETVVAPGLGTAGSIAAAVNAINPKGKTPLSAAVIAAAEALRYGEEKATVILVSDGIETCDLDPCAVGRKLEQTGVDFTAHVIGFDLESEPEALAQLQCLAEETGGIFRSAADAGELSDALREVSAPAPEPEPATVTLVATEGAGGARIGEGLTWSLTTSMGVPLLSGATEAAPVLPLPPGTYTATVTRAGDGASATREVAVDTKDRTVTLILPDPAPEPVRIRVHAVDGKHGRVIPDGLVWELTGPEGVIFTGRQGGALDLELTRGTYAVSVLRPADEAHAEQRFGVGSVPNTVRLTLPEFRPGATLDAPATGVAGSTVQVAWTGPDAKDDYIAVTPTDETRHITYTYTREGPLLDLLLPSEPGSYAVRYILRDGRKALATSAIEVTPATATLDAPAAATAGATVQVGWTGPDYKDDYIAVVARGDEKHITYTYTREGAPLDLLMPAEPGEYDILYVMRQDRKALARTPITVTGTEATLDAPASATAGATVQVGWTGPDYKDDYIAVVPRGEDRHVTYTYTREGAPLDLLLPAEPGEYDILYVMRQDRTIIARTPITLSAATAEFSAPDTVAAGGSVEVTWTGPDYARDYIAIFPAGAADGKYTAYTYTRDGSPLTVAAPDQPGAYELRYILGQNRKSLSSVVLTVE